MPDVLPKGSVPEARGNEPATRLSILQSISKIAEQYQQEQFLVRPQDVTYAGGILSVAYGPGQIRFGNGFVAFAAGVAAYSGPAAATAYFLIARNNGAVLIVPLASYVQPLTDLPLWLLTTGNPVANGTTVLADRRGFLPIDPWLPGGIGTTQLADLSVTAAKLADSSVVSRTIPTGAIGTGHVADRTVTEPKLADAAVISRTISTGAIGTGHVADGSITAPKLGALSVATGTVQDGAVTTPKIGDGQVTKAKLGADVPMKSVARMHGLMPAAA